MLPLLFLPALPSFASSSGLNNIPTTDTPGHLILVFQNYPTFGAGRPTSDVVGFKFGVDVPRENPLNLRLELGMDSVVRPDAGPAALQAKIAIRPIEGGPAIAIGVANVTATREDRLRGGEPVTFVMLSQDFRVARLHGGYGLQAGHGNSALLGADRSLTLWNRKLVVRGDAVQTNRGQNWAASFGGLYVVQKHVAIESWITQPVSGGPPSFTIKLNLITGF